MNKFYRDLGSSIFNLIRLHVSFKLLNSSFKLKSIKNKYKGDKAIILCNGPSLNLTDFNLIQRKNIFTVGLNKINLLFEKTNFRPSCIVSINPYVIQQNKDFFNNTDIDLFIDGSINNLSLIKKRENVNFINPVNLRIFSENFHKYYFQGYTVTYAALQLCFHLGFRKVTLVGCDHYFSSKGKSNKLVKGLKNDVNHFHPKYFSEKDNWQLPDLLNSEISYLMAKDVYENHGREIVNSTIGGDLNIYKRVSLEDFLK